MEGAKNSFESLDVVSTSQFQETPTSAFLAAEFVIHRDQLTKSTGDELYLGVNFDK